MIFLVSLEDLSSIEGRDLASGTEAEVITRLREVYDFLPKETRISVNDGIIRIDIPEQVIANKLEAARLQEKASQRANQGEYQKAAGTPQLPRGGAAELQKPRQQAAGSELYSVPETWTPAFSGVTNRFASSC